MFHVEDGPAGVRVLTLDDGKVNAISPAFLEAFPSAWAEATEDEPVLVLTGNARAFSAGLDLKTLPTLGPPELVAFMGRFNRMVAELALYPRPVVAAVEGPAMAGGAILALAADIRITGPGARMGLTEARVGVPFPPPIVELARAALPAPEHGPALLAAVIREGAACLEHGWSHEHVDEAAVRPTALERAAELASLDPLTQRRAKGGLRADLARAAAAWDDEAIAAYIAELADPARLEALETALARATGR